MKSAETWAITVILATAGMYTGLAYCAPEKAGALDTLQPASRPAELKLLDTLIGDWDHAMSVMPEGDKSKEIKQTGTFTRKWILDGQFVQETGNYSDGTKALVMFGYDREKKAYRIWWFNSSGTGFDSLGQWDDATKTMAGKTEHSHGISTSWTLHFVDNNSQEWTAVTKDSTGKILVEAGGKCTRKK